jgi:hypothetical protein
VPITLCLPIKLRLCRSFCADHIVPIRLRRSPGADPPAPITLHLRRSPCADHLAPITMHRSPCADLPGLIV